jgi:hypothetical protein
MAGIAASCESPSCHTLGRLGSFAHLLSMRVAGNPATPTHCRELTPQTILEAGAFMGNPVACISAIALEP